MEGIIEDVVSGKIKVRCSIFGNETGRVTASSFLDKYHLHRNEVLDRKHAWGIEATCESEGCGFAKLGDILEEGTCGELNSWNQIDPSKFENYLLEFIRLQAEGLFEAAKETNATQNQGSSSAGGQQSQKDRDSIRQIEKPSALYHYEEDDFPSLGVSDTNERKSAVKPEDSCGKSPLPSGLEARISKSANSGQKPPAGPKRKHSGRRIVPTAVQNVEVDEKFVGNFEDVGDLKDDGVLE